MRWEQILVGLLLSSLIGGLGYWRKALDLSGVAGAVLVGTVIFGAGGWTWGLLLITFFISSSWLSFYRRTDKREIGEKFAKGSRRDLGQALANGGSGAILAAAFACYPHPLLFAAFLGAMATVNADTWATELGVLSPDLPRLVTNGKRVPPGTSGGVTSLGTWAAVAGALLVGVVASAAALPGAASLPQSLRGNAIAYPLLAVVGGVAGSFLDSLMGATLQGIYYCARCGQETENREHCCARPGSLRFEASLDSQAVSCLQPIRGWPWLNNDLVNFLSSIAGGALAASLAWFLWR